MRWLAAFLLGSSMMFAQQAPQQVQAKAASNETSVPASASDKLVIPAGTRIPLALKAGLSTKSARAGDSVYAETTFPLAIDDRIVVPAGTYVQGVISRVQRPGHVKGKAEVQFHFTTLVFPSGYTVMLTGSVENLPGQEATRMKDNEGTVQAEGTKGRDVATVASTTATGAAIGGIAEGGKGAGIGAGIGGATGLLITMLSRGNEVRLEPGTSVEMVIQRQVELDAKRIAAAK